MSGGGPRQHRLRSAIMAVLGFAWVGLGLLVGWFVGYLADRLALPAHHALIYAALALAGVVLCAWAYGTRLLYLEVRAGLDEARNGELARGRTGSAWAAAMAGPIVGLVLGLSGHSVAATGGRLPDRPAVVASAERTAPRLDLSPIRAPQTAAATEAGAGRPAAPRASRSEGSTAAQSDAAAAAGGAAAGGSALAALEVAGALAGFGVLGGGLLAAHLAKLRRYQRMRAGVGALPPALADGDAASEAALRPLRTLELPAWIDAANRLLCARLLDSPGIEPPRISVVRAGRNGVEMLLDRPRPNAPAGFLATDGGQCWRLAPTGSLGEVRAAAGAAQPYLAVLVPVAEDATGSYLVACGPGESLAVRGGEDDMRRALGAIWVQLATAPWAEVSCYRVGVAGFPGAGEMPELTVEAAAGIAGAGEATGGGATASPLWRASGADSQPVLFAAEPALAEDLRRRAPSIAAVIGTMLEADRLLWYEDGTVTIEPLGLTLPALLPTDDELSASLRLAAAASALPSPVAEALDAPAPGHVGGPAPAPAAGELPVAGAVELRLLRPVPDLVGEVDPAKLHPEVVQVVAYLALHNNRATTSKLRDVFGRYKREESRAARTVWNATSHTRNVLGPERFPVAHGNRPYTLDESVTCDWVRLRRLVATGRALQRAGEPVRAIEAMRAALELVGDGYPCSDDSIAARYDWLDAEQLLVELETDVVRAAHVMASLSIEYRPSPRSLDDAAWAIGRGRVISPEALPLREVALRLAAAREDQAALDGEFLSAVDAVDELALGLEVDPSLEATYRRLGRQLEAAAARGRARLA